MFVGVICEDKKSRFARKKDPFFSIREVFFFRLWCGFLKRFAQQETESKWRWLLEGSTIDLQWVQVHPTGLVKIAAEDEKIKFLAAEALGGVGGLLIDKNGKWFCKGLGKRGYVGSCGKMNSPSVSYSTKKPLKKLFGNACKLCLGRDFFFF